MIKLVYHETFMSITVAVIKDRILSIGTAQCSCAGTGSSIMYFNRLYVTPEYRHKGFGTVLLKKLLKIIKERHLVLQLDINPYGDMDYDQLEKFYTKYGFEKVVDGDFYTYYFNKDKEEIEMDISSLNINDFNVDKKNIATVVNEQTFYIGEDASIEVMVNLYEHNGSYKITSWLNGCEELNTVDYEGSINNSEEIIAAMEKLVNDNEDYILDVVSWDGE